MIRIVSAEPLSNFRLKITFNDGVSGIFAVEPERRGGVFQKLLDANVFNSVTINPDFGCVEWPGGVDLCPTAMHQTIMGAETKGNIETGAGLALREEVEKETKTK